VGTYGIASVLYLMARKLMRFLKDSGFLSPYIQWCKNPQGSIKTCECLFHLFLLGACDFKIFVSLMFSILDLLVNVSYVFMGLYILFHQFVVRISYFVGLVCLGVRCTYVVSMSLTSLLFDVCLEIKMFLCVSSFKCQDISSFN